MKMTLYPKTRRYSDSQISVTEKIDGSNLGFFKHEGELYIAQRNNIFSFTNRKDISYKGLGTWLETNGFALKESLVEGACIFGEWVGMGRLKYPEFHHQFLMFAKANIRIDSGILFETYNMRYEHTHFVYPFVEQTMPDFIKVVPIINVTDVVTKSLLDEVYKIYTKEVGRDVEGFVIRQGNDIQKYVRMKSGKLESHRS